MGSTLEPQEKIDLPPTAAAVKTRLRVNRERIQSKRASEPRSSAQPRAWPPALAGPVGTAVGAIGGGIAGGYAGKGIGELIDPTTEDNWLRDNFKVRPYAKGGDKFEDSFLRFATECSRSRNTATLEST